MLTTRSDLLRLVQQYISKRRCLRTPTANAWRRSLSLCAVNLRTVIDSDDDAPTMFSCAFTKWTDPQNLLATGCRNILDQAKCYPSKSDSHGAEATAPDLRSARCRYSRSQKRLMRDMHRVHRDVCRRDRMEAFDANDR